MFAGNGKGHLAADHQGDARAVFGIHLIDRVHFTRLGAQFFRQIRHQNWADIDIVAFDVGHIEFHHNPLFAANANGLHHSIRHDAAQVDVQQSVFRIGPRHFDPIRQNKATLKCARCNTTVQKYPLAGVFGLATAHDQLPILDGDRQIILVEPGHRQGDAIGVFRCRLDVKGRIPFGGGFCRAFDQPFQLFKAQQIGMSPKADFRHLMPFHQATCSIGPNQAAKANMGCPPSACKGARRPVKLLKYSAQNSANHVMVVAV